jgi:hypothetical protein
MLAFRSVVSVLLRALETFLYTLKAGPAGGRLRRPSSAGKDTVALPPVRAVLASEPVDWEGESQGTPAPLGGS